MHAGVTGASYFIQHQVRNEISLETKSSRHFIAKTVDILGQTDLPDSSGGKAILSGPGNKDRSMQTPHISPLYLRLHLVCVQVWASTLAGPSCLRR